MLKQTLIFTVVVALVSAGSAFAKDRGGFSFKSSGSKSSNSRSFGSNSNSHRSNSSHNNHQKFNHHKTQTKKTFQRHFDHNKTRTGSFGASSNPHREQTRTHGIKIHTPGNIKPITRKPEIKAHVKGFPHVQQHHDWKHKIQHHVDKHVKHVDHNVHKPHGEHNNKHNFHHKPHFQHHNHAKPCHQVWWGCHKPVHCHSIIKVPCVRPVTEVIVEQPVIEQPLPQVMVNTTIQLDMAGLSPEAGQLIVQVDMLSLAGQVVEWTPTQAKVTIPMMTLSGPMKATMHIINADGSVAQSVNVELIPFSAQAVAVAQ